MIVKSRIIVFTGDGRGKTSAAWGLALRALGRGRRVYIAQFLKRRPSGEGLALAKRRGVKLENFGSGRFVRGGRLSAREVAETKRGYRALRRALDSGRYYLLVADEICTAQSLGLLSAADVLELARSVPRGCRLVLTGHRATRELIKLADDVTEMKKVKHSFDKGVKAELGLEY